MSCSAEDIIKTIKAIRHARDYLTEDIDLRQAKNLVDVCREVGCPVVIGELRDDAPFFGLVSELTEIAEGNAVFSIDPTESAITRALVFDDPAPNAEPDEEDVAWIELNVASTALVLLAQSEGNIIKAIVSAQLLAHSTETEFYTEVEEFIREAFVILSED